MDLLLVHTGGDGVAKVADALWYPLWDAGLIVGHAARTVREALAVADADVQALTSMLDVRHVAGDADLTSTLVERVRGLARRRQRRLVDALAGASDVRRDALIADLLEPNLKEGGGGLRDLHALEWAGWALGDPGGLTTLVQRGYLRLDDPARLADARELLLTVRVALHRVTRGKGDSLALQEQDAVASWAGAGDADELARRLAEAARAVAWVASDVWARLRATYRGPLGRLSRRDRVLGRGVVLRDGRATLAADADPDGAAALRLAAEAAQRDVPVDRDALARLAQAAAEAADGDGWLPKWDDDARQDFLRLLRAGWRAVAVIESLAQAGLWERLVPEWQHVRSLPQRNAYHRFAVDRHLLQAVAECAALLDGNQGPSGPAERGTQGPSGPAEREGRTFDAEVAAGLDRPELLVLAALVHDIGKGLPGDHSDVGAELAGGLCRRIGIDDEGTARVETAVRRHLLLAEVATRRDLAEEATAARVARLAGDPRTLELLYLLTLGDSRATGPAAWGPVKAVLVRELFVKALNLLERGEVAAAGPGEERRAALAGLVGRGAADAFLDAMPPSYPLAFTPEQMAHHRELLDRGGVEVEWSTGVGDRPVCTVVAPDRPGMLAAVAGVMAAHGLNVQELHAHTRADGMALEVIRVYDQYGRLAKEGGPERVTADVRAALEGEVDVAARVRQRAEQYAPSRRRQKPPTPPEVIIDQEASDFATVVEVHADDRVGLLFQITEVLAGLGLDVHLAKINTVGDRVVDAFYVRDGAGGKLADPAEIDRLRHTLLGALRRS